MWQKQKVKEILMKKILYAVFFSIMCTINCQAGEKKQICPSVCSTLCSKSRDRAVCFGSCVAVICGPAGVASGSSASSSYPSGGSTGSSSSGASSQADTYWAWGGVNGRDKIYFSSYEAMQDYLYKNSGNCGGE